MYNGVVRVFRIVEFVIVGYGICGGLDDYKVSLLIVLFDMCVIR